MSAGSLGDHLATAAGGDPIQTQTFDETSEARSELDRGKAHELRVFAAIAVRLLDELSAGVPNVEGVCETIASARRELSTILGGSSGAEPAQTDELDERIRRATRLTGLLYGWRHFLAEVSPAETRRPTGLPGTRQPIRLEPQSGIAVHVADQDRYEWLSSDNDPQFSLHGLKGFAGSWVELSFQLDIESGWGHPVLYVDAGLGFDEETAIRIPRPWPPGSRSYVLFFVPREVVTVRLDPFSTVGVFQLGSIGARAISRPVAAMRMLFAIKSARRMGDLVRPSTGGLVRGFRQRLVRTYAKAVQGNSYGDWISCYEPATSDGARLAAEEASWKRRPLISVVVPVYNTPEQLLRAAIDSVLAQSYPHWELCIANDASPRRDVRTTLDDYASSDTRIKVVHRSVNGHISAATNSALELATGEFLAFLDHDDRLHPNALHYVAKAICERPDAGIIYTDEDKLDEEGRRFTPYFKSEFNPQLFLSHNMICHLGCYRRDLVERVGGFRTEFDGSQDYDLALRIVELLDRRQIIHIPRVLYHWTAIEGSTSLRGDAKPYAHIAAMKAIQAHLDRTGVSAEVVEAPESKDMNRVRYALPAPPPSVCVVIPTRDRVDLLNLCIGSLRARTKYQNFSICVVDNGSVEPATRLFFDRERERGVKVLRDDCPFNFSALNNRAIQSIEADYVVLMNNDIEVVSSDWIEEMLGHAIQPGVAAVGARLWYPDGRLQHGGVILGIGGVAGHSHKGLSRGHVGYFSRAVLQQDFSAVTAACLMIKRSIYSEIGGLDENLRVAFNDVDFCLRLIERGYRNVWTPYAEFIHHESASRGGETTPEKRARFLAEARLMKQRWGSMLEQDPAYSPNLTLETEDFAVAWPPRVRDAPASSLAARRQREAS